MPKRITIMLSDDLIKKLRTIQSAEIKKTSGNVSFSQVINQVLQKHIK